MAAYANSFCGVFLFDDIHDIVDNSSVHRFWPPWECMLAPRSYGRPVVMLTFAANYALGGANPWGYHAFNLSVHVLSALLLFGIVRWTLVSARLRERFGGAATYLALIVALLWLVHPLQTQAVTYVIQRFESLMAFFFLLTLYCFIRGSHSQRRGKWHAAAVAACALGMGCKQVMVAAPLVVLLYDLVFVEGSWRAAAGRWKLHAALAATWALLATLLIAAPQLPPTESELVGHTALQYFCSQPGVILHYLWLVVWPRELCLDYLWPVATTAAGIRLPGLVVLALLGATVWALWRAPGWGFCGAWFFLILAPTSSVMPIGDLAFEHRMYLPLAAPVAAASSAIFLASRKLLENRGARGAAVGLAVLVFLGLTWRTIQRNRDYASDVAMWTKVVEQRPKNSRAHLNLGKALGNGGRLEEAIAHCREAIEIKPDLAEAHYNLGVELAEAGRLEEAMAHYRKTIEIKPDYAAAHLNLGLELVKARRPDEAMAHYRKAIEIKPDYADAHYNLGNNLAKAGRLEEAITHYRKATEIKPDHADAHLNLGVELVKAGRLEEAIAHYRTVIEIVPDSADAYHNLGSALGQAGRLEEAIAVYKEEIRLKPDYAGAHNDLGVALARQGILDQAAVQFREALRIQPDNTMARENLAAVLRKQGQTSLPGLNGSDRAPAKH